jgi:hypothetical protein
MISSRDWTFSEPEEFILDLELPLVTNVQSVLTAALSIK